MKRILFYVSMINKDAPDHYMEDYDPISKELDKMGVPHWLVNSRFEKKQEKSLFNKYKPTDVFFRLPGLARDSNSIFKRHKCKTHCILHGWPVKSSAHFPVYTDYIYSWGRIANKILRDHGTPPKKIITTGSPRFDIISKMVKNKRYNKVPVVGFASVPYHIWKQPNFKHEAMVYANAVYGLDPVAFPKILQRLHPVEQSEHPWLRDYKLAANERVIFCDPYKEKFLDWLMKIDILVTTQSGTAIEAACLGVPVITMSFFGRKEYVPTGSHGLSINVTKPQDLPGAMIKAYHQRGIVNPSVKLFNEYLDGSCASRIVDHVMKC